jgi:alginate O-acetyltransferase complex protein AlgI
MELTSPFFLGFAALGLAAYWAVDRSSVRQTVLVGLNLGFVASFFASPLHALPLAAFLLLGYAALRMAAARKVGIPGAVLLAGLIVAFVYMKRYAFLAFVEPLPFAYSAIGLSYILFRVLHVVIDTKGRDLEAPPSVLEYLGFVLFFPAFISGPIQRLQDFRRLGWTEPVTLDRDGVFAAFSRILVGYIKVCLVSLAFGSLFGTTSTQLLAQGSPMGKATALFVVSAALYTLYLYFNFSGYTDIVIGIGRLFGFVLPENFNRPFAARNALDFWTRWHMSLSEWFKLYLFNPLLKWLMGRNSSAAAAPFLAVAAFFVTFLVIGIWHGSTTVFLYYGVLLGAGVSLNKLYQVLLTKRIGKKRYQGLTKHPLYLQACRGLTFAYFATALTCFWVDSQQLGLLLGLLGPMGVPVAVALLTLGAAVTMAAFDGMERAAIAASSRLALEGAAWGDAWLGAKIVALVTLSTLFNTGPEFVYQAF